MANLYKSKQFMQLAFGYYTGHDTGYYTGYDILLYLDSSRYWHVLVRALGVCDDVKWTLNYNQPYQKWNAQYAHRQMLSLAQSKRWCICT